MKATPDLLHGHLDSMFIERRNQSQKSASLLIPKKSSQQIFVVCWQLVFICFVCVYFQIENLLFVFAFGYEMNTPPILKIIILNT